MDIRLLVFMFIKNWEKNVEGFVSSNAQLYSFMWWIIWVFSRFYTFLFLLFF